MSRKLNTLAGLTVSKTNIDVSIYCFGAKIVSLMRANSLNVLIIKHRIDQWTKRQSFGKTKTIMKKM